MDENKIEDKFNIMFIGDINVGKTTILESYFNSNSRFLTEESFNNKKASIG